MIETKIEWNGSDGKIIEDGTIEIALLAATEEAKPLVDKLYEIANRYGVSISTSTSDMLYSDGEVGKYTNVCATYTRNNVRHCVSQSKMKYHDSHYSIDKYVWVRDEGEEPYEDSPCEIKACG